jgi:hypothetical protein
MLVPKVAIAVYACLDIALVVHREVIMTAETVDRIGVVSAGWTLHPQALKCLGTLGRVTLFSLPS